MILYLVTAPALSSKERRYCTPHYFPRHFFPPKKPSCGVSISRLLAFFFLRDRYHSCTIFVDGGVENRFFTANALISEAQDSVWVSQLSLCDTFLLLIQRWGYGEVVFVMFISTSEADWKREVQGCVKASSTLWPQRKKNWVEVCGLSGADMVQFSSGVKKNPSWKMQCLNLDEET